MFQVFVLLSTLSAAIGRPEFRVARGSNAIPHEFPSIVAIESYEDNEGRWVQYCGGTMLNGNSVMTAAHCKLDGKKIRISAGIQRLSDERVNIHANVVKQIRYPTYDPDDNVSHDIMILKLDRHIPESKKVRYVRIPEVQGKTPAISTRCMVAGWGLTSVNQGDEDTNVLQKGPMIAKINENYYGDRTVFTATAGGSRYSGTCEGDSGGPLYCPALDGGRSYQVGIVSAGDDGKCVYASRSGSGQFARVSYFVNWIKKQMRN